MLDEIAGKEHPGLNAFGFQAINNRVSGDAGLFFHRQEKTEPAWVGVGRRLRQNESIGKVGQAVAQ